jgi:hypothetical protein
MVQDGLPGASARLERFCTEAIGTISRGPVTSGCSVREPLCKRRDLGPLHGRLSALAAANCGAAAS